MDQPLTLKDHRRYVSRMRSEVGARGGKAKVRKGIATLSPEARAEISRTAVAARAAKRLNRLLGGGLDEPRSS